MPASPDSAQPRALIVTIYGLYARVQPARDPAAREGAAVDPDPGVDGSGTTAAADGAGWLPVSLLVRLLAELEIDEPAVRSAISRLKRRGFLVASRRDGVAGYGISATFDAILAEGDARIFAPAEPSLADGWVLAVFSVPETERAQRHALRVELGALGFGACAPGVFVAPAHRFDLTATSLRRHGFAPYVDLFRAEYLAFGDIAEHARQWWDLDAVRAAYADYLAVWGGAAVPVDPARAFAIWIRSFTAWRRLPYVDPGLPVELLPPDWPAPAARKLFARLQATLSQPASTFVAATTDAAVPA